MTASAIRNSQQGSAGMPLAIQVATPQWRDEECVAIMKIISGVTFKTRPKTPSKFDYN